MKLLIISGVSGSGKSVALQTLEDQDYLCIDNLPLSLLPDLARQLQQQNQEAEQPQPCAIGVDARNITSALQDFPALIETLAQDGVQCQVIFLDADDNVLLKRFSETRRKHPLTNKNMPLTEAIAHERVLLSHLREQAGLRLDTSQTNVHQLRQLIIDRVVMHKEGGLSLSIFSFGFKYGTPTSMDFLFDVRCLPNPHWEPSLRHQTGKDTDVIAFLESQPAVQAMQQQISDFIAYWLPHFAKNNRSYLTIAIGCTGGQHRSVYLVEALSHILSRQSNLIIRHRELR